MGIKNGKSKRLDERTFTKALGVMFKNIKSGGLIYIVFSKKSFHILIFTLAMSIIANVILVYLLVNYPILTGGLLTGSWSMIIYFAQLILSIVAIISGIWLVFRGIDIVTDSTDIK